MSIFLSQLYSQYPKNRRIVDLALIEKIKSAIELGANEKRLRHVYHLYTYCLLPKILIIDVDSKFDRFILTVKLKISTEDCWYNYELKGAVLNCPRHFTAIQSTASGDVLFYGDLQGAAIKLEKSLIDAMTFLTCYFMDKVREVLHMLISQRGVSVEKSMMME